MSTRFHGWDSGSSVDIFFVVCVCLLLLNNKSQFICNEENTEYDETATDFARFEKSPEFHLNCYSLRSLWRRQFSNHSDSCFFSLADEIPISADDTINCRQRYEVRDMNCQSAELVLKLYLPAGNICNQCREISFHPPWNIVSYSMLFSSFHFLTLHKSLSFFALLLVFSLPSLFLFRSSPERRLVEAAAKIRVDFYLWKCHGFLWWKCQQEIAFQERTYNTANHGLYIFLFLWFIQLFSQLAKIYPLLSNVVEICRETFSII